MSDWYISDTIIVNHDHIQAFYIKKFYETLKIGMFSKTDIPKYEVCIKLSGNEILHVQTYNTIEEAEKRIRDIALSFKRY